MVKYKVEVDWNKLISMSLILLSLFIWIGFRDYLARQSSIYIGQSVAPLIIIGLLNLIGVLFSLRIKKGLMKYVLLSFHLTVIYFTVITVYNIFEIGGGTFNVLKQISY